MMNSETNRNQTHDAHLDTELLSAYIDGEVTRQEATRVERHLQACRRCNEEVDSLRWTVDLLREVPAVPVPRSFVIRPADLEPEPARQRFRLPDWLAGGLQWATVATAILTLLVFSVDFFTAGGVMTSAPAAREAPGLLSVQEGSAPQAAEAPAPEQPAEAAPVPESAANSTAPQPAVTAEQEASPPVELATGPEEQPAPTDDGQAKTQMMAEEAQDQVQEEAVEAMREAPAAEEEEAVEATREAPAAGEAAPEAQAFAAPAPTEAPALTDRATSQSLLRDPLRIAEVGLVALLIVLLILTLWIRRQRPV